MSQAKILDFWYKIPVAAKYQHTIKVNEGIFANVNTFLRLFQTHFLQTLVVTLKRVVLQCNILAW